MKLNMYAIKDNVQGEYMNPILLFLNDEECKRAFGQAINTNNGSHINLYYKDLSMYKIGEYDTKSAEIKAKVEFICNGIELKAQKEEKDGEI